MSTTASSGVRSPSSESVSSPPGKGAKKDGKIALTEGSELTLSRPPGGGVVTGSLRINVSGLQDKELDIPYIEDTSASKPKVGWLAERYNGADGCLCFSIPARGWCSGDFPRTVTGRCCPVRSTCPA